MHQRNGTVVVGSPEWREKHAEALALLERMRVIDDTLARRVFRDNAPLAERVLRVVTGVGELSLTSCETQRDVKSVAGSRSLELDVWCVGADGTVYDLEVQTGDDADPKRLRYHAAASDVDSLTPNEGFSALPATWVVFVMEEDPFGDGLGTYLFERTCEESGRCLGDGARLLYANGSYRGDGELGSLMADFLQPDPDLIRDDLMRERVQYLKRDERGVAEMCQMMEEWGEQIRERTAREVTREVTERNTLEHLRDIIDSFKVGSEDALASLRVPRSEWPHYLALLGE